MSRGSLANAAASPVLGGRKPRLAVAVPSFPRYSETFITNAVLGAAERGWDVRVIAVQRTAEITHDSERRALEAATVEAWGPLLPKATRPCRAAARILRSAEVRRAAPRLVVPRRGSAGHALTGALVLASSPWVRGSEPDVVHAHFGHIAAITAELKRRGIIAAPLVATFHGSDLNRRIRQSPRAFDTVFEQCDRITVGSEFMRSVAEQAGAPPHKVSIVPMGVDVDAFSFRQRELPEGAAELVCVARLDPVKGIDDLVRAVALCHEAGTRVRLRVAGDGPQRAELEALASRIGRSGDIEFLGRQPQSRVLELLHGSHLFVLPGRVAADGAVEGQGLVIAEAQATGLPVVCSSAGGAAGGIEDGRTGKVYAWGDAASLADAIGWCLADGDRYARMSAAGRALVESRFSLDRMSSAFDAIYRDLLRHRSGGER